MVGARFPGRRHAFRVTCPGLFTVALSGLQEHKRMTGGWGFPALYVPRGQGRVPAPSCVPRGRGVPRSDRGWNPAFRSL